ncbi:MAG: N-acetylmuramoyl-L-alanine amidase [Ilumatobacteraceae bacterium]|nr:N-acetylmuramoyl-L-alanine amidase [Ilumatobacteraceae bacterium]
MSKKITFGRRGMIAAAAGAVVGAIIPPDGPPAFAASGGGDQGPLILGSNPFFVSNTNAANTANVSSAMTVVQASPNLGNFVTDNTKSVFQIDARPANSNNIIGIEAFGRGDGAAITATSSATGQATGVEAIGGAVGIKSVGNQFGLEATSTGTGVGVEAGEATAGVFGVAATGYGAMLVGGLAPLFLKSNRNPGPPTTDAHTVGEIMVDSNGTFFACRASGTPGTWTNLSGPVFNTLPTPERFVDTRSGLGGVTGPVNGGTTKTFQMSARNGAANNPALQIPDNATTLVGNLTVLGGPNISNGAFVTLWPGGPQPTVSNINVGPGGIIANSFVVGTASVGGHQSISVFNAQQCDYILDVTGFYT